MASEALTELRVNVLKISSIVSVGVRGRNLTVRKGLIMSFLTQVFAAQAFQVEDLTRPEHLYKLKVESFLKESVVTWEPFVHETPMFRN
jgi:Protein of unknown function (DUF3435)